MAEVLSSIWDGLSPHLVASLYEVRKGDSGWSPLPDNDRVVVKAVITQADMEITLGWHNQFESADTGFNTTQSLLQAGYPQQLLETFGIGESQLKVKAASLAQKFVGRTGITKLNSTQVFNGMQPAKISATLLFRAWKDPEEEVERPFNQLIQWALPQKLANNGPVIARLIELLRGDEKNVVDALMPSSAPVVVSMMYKQRYYSPLVIESIGVPLDAQIDAFGRYVNIMLPVVFSTLTAIDRNDWNGFSNYNMIAL